MCTRIKLYEVLRLFRHERKINLHVVLPRGEYVITKTVIDMLKEYATARKHDVLWKVSMYNRYVTLVDNNLDCLEVWLVKEKE